MSPFHPLTSSVPLCPAVAPALSYEIEIEFTRAHQRHLLTYLRDNQYQLLAYKGASGAGQLPGGMPTWLAEPFERLVQPIVLCYQPSYKVYVCRQADLAAGAPIRPDQLSDVTALGRSVVLHPDGSLQPGPAPAAAGGICLLNNADPGSPAVTVGLAALLNGEYRPFCAFRSLPQSQVLMTPHENICLLAAPTALPPGALAARTAAAGCAFPLTYGTPFYTLTIRDETCVLASDWPTLAQSVAPGAALAPLLNAV